MKTYIFYQSLSIKLIAFMIMVISLVSCAKQEIISDLDFQKSLLAGSGSYQNTKRTWKIDSLTQNGVVLNLSIAQKRYTKTFFTDGTYADSDGNLGAWSMPSTKDLTIISNNGISKIKYTNKYEVVDINSAQLHLKYDSASIKQELYFIIAN
jgi:hypothetical protein